MNDIQFFTDEDLLALYQINAAQLSIARRKTNLYGDKIPQFLRDQMDIEREIDGRVSIDFMNELQELKQGSIRPGNWYHHLCIPFLRLQVVDDHEHHGPLYSVRCFLGRTYACRFIVKSSTLSAQFKPIAQ